MKDNVSRSQSVVPGKFACQAAANFEQLATKIKTDAETLPPNGFAQVRAYQRLLEVRRERNKHAQRCAICRQAMTFHLPDLHPATPVTRASIVAGA